MRLSARLYFNYHNCRGTHSRNSTNATSRNIRRATDDEKRFVCQYDTISVLNVRCLCVWLFNGAQLTQRLLMLIAFSREWFDTINLTVLLQYVHTLHIYPFIHLCVHWTRCGWLSDLYMKLDATLSHRVAHPPILQLPRSLLCYQLSNKRPFSNPIQSVQWHQDDGGHDRMSASRCFSRRQCYWCCYCCEVCLPGTMCVFFSLSWNYIRNDAQRST